MFTCNFARSSKNRNVPTFSFDPRYSHESYFFPGRNWKNFLLQGPIFNVATQKFMTPKIVWKGHVLCVWADFRTKIFKSPSFRATSKENLVRGRAVLKLWNRPIKSSFGIKEIDVYEVDAVLKSDIFRMTERITAQENSKIKSIKFVVIKISFKFSHKTVYFRIWLAFAEIHIKNGPK